MLLFEWLAPPFAWKQRCLPYYMTCVIMRSIFASPGNKNCSHYLFTTYLVRKNADLIMQWRGNVTNESSPLTNRQRRDLEQFCCYRYTHWRQDSKDAGLGKAEHELKKKKPTGGDCMEALSSTRVTIMKGNMFFWNGLWKPACNSYSKSPWKCMLCNISCMQFKVFTPERDFLLIPFL